MGSYASVDKLNMRKTGYDKIKFMRLDRRMRGSMVFAKSKSISQVYL